MTNNNGAAAGGGAIYGLGMFGAWVYFWQQADSFWEHVLAVLQGLVWPAFMVYEAFSALADDHRDRWATGRPGMGRRWGTSGPPLHDGSRRSPLSGSLVGAPGEKVTWRSLKSLHALLHSRLFLVLGIALAVAVPALTLPGLPSVTWWPVALGLLPWVVGKYLLCPLRWRALTNADLGRWWHIRAYAESELLGLLTPGHVGADLWRIRRLTHAGLGRGDAVASVAVDRTVGAMGLAVFVVFAGSALPVRMLLAALGIGLAAILVLLVVRKVRPHLLPTPAAPATEAARAGPGAVDGVPGDDRRAAAGHAGGDRSHALPAGAAGGLRRQPGRRRRSRPQRRQSSRRRPRGRAGGPGHSLGRRGRRGHPQGGPRLAARPGPRRRQPDRHPSAAAPGPDRRFPSPPDHRPSDPGPWTGAMWALPAHTGGYEGGRPSVRHVRCGSSGRPSSSSLAALTYFGIRGLTEGSGDLAVQHAHLIVELGEGSRHLRRGGPGGAVRLVAAARHVGQLGLHLGSLAGDRGHDALDRHLAPLGLPPAARRHARVRSARHDDLRDLPGRSAPGWPAWGSSTP